MQFDEQCLVLVENFLPSMAYIFSTYALHYVICCTIFNTSSEPFAFNGLNFPASVEHHTYCYFVLALVETSSPSMAYRFPTYALHYA